MLRIICAKVAAAFPPLPPLPVRPLLGAGAAIGPIRPAVVCVAILCASSTATAPPQVSELIPRPEPATIKTGPAAYADHLTPVVVPAPGGLAVFGVGVAALLVLRRRCGK